MKEQKEEWGLMRGIESINRKNGEKNEGKVRTN